MELLNGIEKHLEYVKNLLKKYFKSLKHNNNNNNNNNNKFFLLLYILYK
jgi:hypothetical protein